ncbi:MAG: hypothetical protein M1829_002730 [Trizodia sp. TS-e1964]|nr:MAG: hypothetical protein M1829_002730 [Trizodia sp. TS-e1964]
MSKAEDPKVGGDTQPLNEIRVNGSSAARPASGSLENAKGWDGKLRVDRKSVVVDRQAISDPEYSDDDAPPTELIQADEDLLEDYPLDSDEIDLVHCRVSSISALRLERFTMVQKVCLRQNAITEITPLDAHGSTLLELDFYDNLISHISGLEGLKKLRSLDLSFNKIRTIKNVNHLCELRDLYFVQNKISNIQGLDGLSKLKNLELAANRIREIQNVQTLAGLEQLWLGKNKITEMKNLSTLVNLKILSIQSNRITAITGLESLVNLEELYISHNALTEISGLENNTKLGCLDVTNNKIKHLTGLSHLENLEEVWASNNELASFDEVEKELADKKKLKTVYFEGNPLQTKSPVLYRNKVRLALPQLQQIDATYVMVS